MKPAVAHALVGWTCDRTPRGMRGAELIARAAAERFGLDLQVHGRPAPPADLLWNDALARGAPAFAAARDAAVSAAGSGLPPLFFANRCGTSLATIPAFLAGGVAESLVWCDAHADYNTPASTPTGYLGGMVIAALCGLWDSGYGAGLAPERTILAGVRDVDPPEAVLLKRDAIRRFHGSQADLDVESIADALAGRRAILHIDADVMDRAYVPAEYDVPGGLHPAALVRLAVELRRRGLLAALEIAEFEPTDDPQSTERAIGHLLDIVGAALGATPDSR
jgi:arginase